MESIANTLKTILEGQPAFRIKQIEKAWFDVSLNSYDEITTLPKDLREKLKDIPWLGLEVHTELKSKVDNTRKYLFKLNDGNLIEMVLMGRRNLKRDQLSFRASSEESLAQSPTIKEGGSNINKVSQRSFAPLRMTDKIERETSDDRYTICISSQAGCPMRCAFCATGKSGFKRNLTAEEIIDQYRFAQRLLAKENNRVNNIVLMGQGEPLVNYENVKKALNTILKNSDIGSTKITLSTVGYVPTMEKMITDTDFPAVRFALSLHSAIEESRKKIIPTHKPGFLEWLVKWGNAYHEKFGNRTHFIGFEYIMLSGVNDDEEHLQALIKFCKRFPIVRVNLIPYNTTNDAGTVDEINKLEEQMGSNYRIFTRTPHELIEHWHESLMKAGITSTIRYSQGQDIAAACGQLRNKEK